MGALRAISEMEEIHAFEIAARWRQMATNRPTIILGDFNSLSAGNAPRFLRDRGFLDSLAVVNPQPDSQHTWHERTMGNDWSLRIDYLFHSPHLTTLESQVIAKPGSDHYPMVSRLRWKAPAKP
jgi:endonuclease/exonuclease/phosphatase family metal-dependent hydrolase